ncbi:MAG TPA: peptidylprolyl isomerase [Casimicrobium sp.]|jgi:peptidyl-prolyl cis-trans isomerase B (cyclophilin B)|nr:peptidylprolyl isomerase [Casimicrobium sp.]HPV24095.1 peptidylprolyl isomerase [Casimicrobium sp.]
MALVKFSTNHGDFTLDIDEVNAPKTAANFLQYVKDGHYDNTIFHRVIEGFMIQGGGFEPGMKQKAGRAPIEHEGVATSKAGLRNAEYTVAMARTNEPHSGSSQFFVNVADNAFLDFKAPSGNSWGYTVFGKVASGTDVVDKIKNVRTGTSGFHQNVPTEDVLVTKAVIV